MIAAAGGERAAMRRCAAAAVLLLSPAGRCAADPGARAKALVANMTLTEQISLLGGYRSLGKDQDHPYVGNIQGIPRLGVPWMAQQDGPQGYRDFGYGKYGSASGTSTQWPSVLAIGATWDTELAGQWGAAMGKEFRLKGANCQLGPAVNVHRVPRNGRNFEYISGEDPHLGYVMVQPVVKGIQSNGVIANAKHYILNNQETERGSISAEIDERTIMEIYHPPFQGAVDAGVGSFMCSYNKINGVHACEDPVTLGQLKGFAGFKGFVMSDWGATHSTVASAKAGLDMEMGDADYYSQGKLAAAVAGGDVAAGDVAEKAERVMTAMFAAGVMDTPQPTGSPTANATSDAHAALALRLAEAGAVLLKNDGGLLPLSGAPSVAVVGAAANCEAAVPSEPSWGWPGPWYGCVSAGGGSGAVVPSRVVSVLAAVSARAGAATYHSGKDTAAAAAAAAAADVAVVVVGETSSEAADRPSTALSSGQVAYLNAVAAAQPKTIVVAMAPGSLVMDWAAKVPAVTCFFLPGQEQGAAVASVLWGDVNPSGRLPVTMPNKENELQLTEQQWPGADGKAMYSEKLEVGYRWYVAHNVTPTFPFGHGLSYAMFAYSGITVAGQTVTADVKNTGGVAGAEVAQLYLGFPKDAGEPPMQLKGFQKVALAPGASAKVTFALSSRDLSIWDVATHGWKEQKGRFAVYVGASVADIRLTATMDTRPRRGKGNGSGSGNGKGKGKGKGNGKGKA